MADRTPDARRRIRARAGLGVLGAIILVCAVASYLDAEGRSRRADGPTFDRSVLRGPIEADSDAPYTSRSLPRAGEGEDRGEGRDTGPPLERVFFGPITLKIRVVDEGGAAVPRARVEVVPENFQPSRPKEWARFSARSNDQGIAVFDRYPAAPHYVAVATTSESYGSGVVRLEGADGEPSEVVVKKLFYERIRVEDEAGRPVSLEGHSPIVWGSTVWSRGVFDGEPRAKLLRRLGLPFDSMRLVPNELVTVYDAERILWRETAGGIEEPMHVIRLPGYEPLRVRVSRTPVRDWPKAKVVTVRRARGAPKVVRYRVALPALDALRSQLGNRHANAMFVRVNVRIKGSADTYVISPGKAAFLAAPGLEFEAWLDGFDALMSCSVLDAAGEKRVEPDYPPLTVVRLRYPLPTRGEPFGGRLRVLAFPSRSYAGKFLWPGATLLGPMPAGQYTFMRLWNGVGGRPAFDRWGPHELAAGFHELEWQ